MEKKAVRLVIFIVFAAIAAYGAVQEANPDLCDSCTHPYKTQIKMMPQSA